MAASALVVAGPPTTAEPGINDHEVSRHLDSVSHGAASDPSGNRRLREGAELVDQVGHFETAKDRLVFVSERGGIRLIGLENLNLERISRTIASYPGRLNWKVSGTVTECRGANYLLVRRALVTTVTD